MRISRIYVDRFGSPTSWYEQITLDLCEPVSGEAIDSCMNLENAGGKTSLLSYIFSCFEPKQERWLQHLQSKAHSFRDYFSRDVRPSFMAIEWIMPPRSPNGRPYRLVVGQAVQLKESADRASEVDRRFFAFESSSGLAWEHLPVPGISIAPVQSMQEFLNWAHHTARLESQGDYYMTFNQGDWVTHLEQRRLIDVELLRMQLSFNSREGGSEEGFLSFSSESDLISKLLHLSMNQEHTVALRDMVAQTMDRLKSKPKYEARLHQLQLLQAAMKPFAENAAKLMGAKAALVELEQDAADTVFTMRDQINGLDVRLAKAIAALTQLEQLATNADNQAASAKRNHLALQGMKLSRADLAAKKTRSDLQEQVTAGQVRLECLKGAMLKREIANAEKLVEELVRQTAALKEELKPLEAETAENGAMLRFLLEQHIEKQEQVRSSLNAQATEANAALSQIAQQREQGTTRRSELHGLRGEVEERVKIGGEVRDGLIESGWFLPTDIDVAAAIERLQAIVDELKSGLNELKEQRVSKKAALDETLGKDALIQKAIINAEHAQEALRQRLRVYDQAVEKLQNDPVLTGLVEGQCDPHALSLITHVQQYIETTNRELSNCAIRLKQLREQQESIEQTGLAGRSDDVDLVIGALKVAGVLSARAANTYIADLRPDAAEARALVLSDPARFLGVNVAKDEWGKALKAAASLDLHLSLPVTLAVASLDAQATSKDRYVLGPEKNSAFNKAAASELLADCQALIKRIDSEHGALMHRQRQAQFTLANLQRFQSDYTPEAIQQIAREIEQLQSELEVGHANHAELIGQAQVLNQELEALSGRIEEIPREISIQENGLQRVVNYGEVWEPKIESGRKELGEINRELLHIDQVLQQLSEEESVQKGRLEDLRNELGEVGSKISNLQREHGQVVRFDSGFDAHARIQEKGYVLSLLQTMYANALQMLSAQEKEKLGIVAYQLEGHRQQASRLAEQYRKDFGRQDEALISELAQSDVDIDFEVESQNRRNARLVADKEQAASNASVTEVLLKKFIDEHVPDQPSVEMEALGDDEVLEAIEREQGDMQAKLAEASSLRRQMGLQNAENEADKRRRDSLVMQVNHVSSAFPAAVLIPKLIDLDQDVEGHIRALLEKRTARDSSVRKAKDETDSAHRQLVKVASHADFAIAEPEVSLHISQDDFDKACSDHDRLEELVNDRVASVTDQLNEMAPDFESCMNEVYNQATSASSLVKHAIGITMPIGTPYVSGKAILKMGGNLSSKSSEQRRIEIRHYLNTQIESGVVPNTGADIITQCLLRFTNNGVFGLQMLKMEQNTEFQYQSVNAMKKSGGQGTVIATFLYMLVSHMRVNTQLDARRGGGGPLLLDNPFANVQTRALIDAQRKLATSLGIQLICFTANADANILEGFRRIIRLRKAGVNSKTKRTHIEMAKATFAEMGPQL